MIATAIHTPELHVDERVLHRPTRVVGTVQDTTWVNLDIGWSYRIRLLGDLVIQAGVLHLERLTVRVGDFITGRCVTTGIRYRGRVAEVLTAVEAKSGVLCRLEMTGMSYSWDEPVEPVVTFEDFLYPTTTESPVEF